MCADIICGGRNSVWLTAAVSTGAFGRTIVLAACFEIVCVGSHQHECKAHWNENRPHVCWNVQIEWGVNVLISCTAQWGVRSATHAPRRVHVIEYDDSSTKGERMIYMLMNVRSDRPIEIVTTTAQRRMEEYFFFSFSLLNNVAIHAHKHTSTRLGRQGKVGYRLGTRPQRQGGAAGRSLWEKDYLQRFYSKSLFFCGN